MEPGNLMKIIFVVRSYKEYQILASSYFPKQIKGHDTQTIKEIIVTRKTPIGFNYEHLLNCMENGNHVRGEVFFKIDIIWLIFMIGWFNLIIVINF